MQLVPIQRGVGSVRGENINLLAIVVPVGITLTGSYFITKSAYPNDFTLLKWIGVPIAIALFALATSLGSAFVFRNG